MLNSSRKRKPELSDELRSAKPRRSCFCRLQQHLGAKQAAGVNSCYRFAIGPEKPRWINRQTTLKFIKPETAKLSARPEKRILSWNAGTAKSPDERLKLQAPLDKNCEHHFSVSCQLDQQPNFWLFCWLINQQRRCSRFTQVNLTRDTTNYLPRVYRNSSACQ